MLGLRNTDDELELKTARDCISTVVKLKPPPINDFKQFRMLSFSPEIAKTTPTVLDNTDQTFRRNIPRKNLKSRELRRYVYSQTNLFSQKSKGFNDSRGFGEIQNIQTNQTTKFNSAIDLKASSHTTTIETDKNTRNFTTQFKASLKEKMGENFNIFKILVGNILKDEEYKIKRDKEFVISKSIRKSVNEWKKFAKNRKNFYSSGNIELPFITQLKSDS
jgi:hypothetical protein